MERRNGQNGGPATHAALGGIALLLLLAVAAAVPTPDTQRLATGGPRHETPREPISVRAFSDAMARAVRGLVGGSTVSAAANTAAALAVRSGDRAGVRAPAEVVAPTLRTVRPELLNLPPPRG